MTTRELMKLIDLCETKYEDYVYIKMYGDGSGGLYSDDSDAQELVTWDDENEIEKTLKEWLKE